MSRRWGNEAQTVRLVVRTWLTAPSTCSTLTAMGVTYAQGYAFGVPRPLEDVLGDLLERRSGLQDFWYAGQPKTGEHSALQSSVSLQSVMALSA